MLEDYVRVQTVTSFIPLAESSSELNTPVYGNRAPDLLGFLGYSEELV